MHGSIKCRRTSEVKTMATRLRVSRIAAGLTQKQLSVCLGESYWYQDICKWENAHVYLPIKIIPKLCKILGITPDYLFGFINKQNENSELPDSSAVKFAIEFGKMQPHQRDAIWRIVRCLQECTK